MSEGNPGKVKISLSSGKILKKHFFATLRPFMTFSLGNECKSTVLSSGHSPDWNICIELPLKSQSNLVVKLYNKGKFSTNLLGETSVPIKSIASKGSEKGIYQLAKKTKKTAEVNLFIEFVPESHTTNSTKQFFSEKTKNQIAQKKHRARKSSKSDLLSRGIRLTDIHFRKRIYQSTSGKQEIHIGRIIPTGVKVAVKVNYCDTPDEFNQVQREALAMCQLSHPNICKAYTSLLDSRHGRLNNLLVMEKCEGWDLYREVKKRAKKEDPWPEEELLSHFNSMISAFSHMQSKKIAHSDIKPQNMVITPNFEIKVIDFGISLQGYMDFFTETSTFKVGGTVPYFSPLQLDAYMKFIKGDNSEAHVRHNPFKSDVYSLGLTFHHMASLEMPKGLNDFSENLQKKVNQTIEQLKYSDRVKKLLYLMLQVEERLRPDFKQLRSMQKEI